jgi:hypothetical protein
MAAPSPRPDRLRPGRAIIEAAVSDDRLDEKLLDWATPTERAWLEAINTYGSARKAAAAKGASHYTAGNAIRRLRKRAAAAGYSPDHDMTRTVPEGFTVRGVSTYYDSEGKARGQWVKSHQAADNAERLIRELVESLTEGIRGASPTISAPALAMADLLCVYPMGDPHFGLYAFAPECGDDFDLDTAERLTCAAIDRLVASAPPAETAIILNLGDFFHGNTEENRTMSGHALDIDTRWSKVMQVGLRAMVYVITAALQKHRRVVVRNVKGNHDRESSFALALALDAFFHNNDRVSVDLSPAAHWYYRFGRVLLGATHGDTTKMANLPGVMAADRPQDWGVTAFRLWLCGHVHHDKVQEFPGVTVEYFRTLAAKDAWHAAQGYRSGRDMRCLVFHRDYGEIERHRCDVAMLEAA